MNEDGLRHLLGELQDMAVESSGLIVYRVKLTWANEGRTGTTDDLVVARDAIQAIQRAWALEDEIDLRTVSVEWICPQESVKSAASITDSTEGWP